MAEEGEETKAQGGGKSSKAEEENAGEAKAAAAAAAGVFPFMSLNIWPPSQRTREAVIQRLVQTLSTESVLSKRYGVLSASDAFDVARRIEEEGFATASAGGGSVASVDGGIEILEIYSKEISKRMLETVKEKASSASGSTSAASPPPSDGGAAVETAPPTTAGEESSNPSPA